MRKKLGVWGILGLGICGLEKEAHIAQAGQQPECAPLLVAGGGEAIQDMNGDGVLDPIAEAVRLLSWAFLGAPAPLPPCASGGPLDLPDTGQTKCYNVSGEELNCNSIIFTPCLEGQDGSYSTGCPSAGRFVDNGDGTVTDNCTGLMWQKDTADTNDDGQLTDQDRRGWCSALTYCDNLSFAGHHDWRLPSIRELQSIVDYGLFNPAIHPAFGAVPDGHWSSTSAAIFTENAWAVGFNIGFSGAGRKSSEPLFVRAVRAGRELLCAPLLVTGTGAVIQDMNGDGVLDPIAEAVRLLSWAFLGAPAPFPPCARGGPSGLPDTGQTKCYTASGRSVDCNSFVLVPCEVVGKELRALGGQDGFYFTGCPSAGRFIDNGDGTVTDNCTGLMWQKDTADMDGDGRLTDLDSPAWCDAITYCDNLSFAGHDDWRLPNVRELQSIVDYGLAYPEMLHPVFTAVGPSYYWSSTSVAGFPSDAWSVSFGLGIITHDDKPLGNFIRAVRGGDSG